MSMVSGTMSRPIETNTYSHIEQSLLGERSVAEQAVAVGGAALAGLGALQSVANLVDAGTVLKNEVSIAGAGNPTVGVAAASGRFTGLALLVAGRVCTTLAAVKSILPAGNALAIGGAATAATPVAAVGLGILGTYRVFTSYKGFSFYHSLMGSIRNPHRGSLAFLRKRLTLTEAEKRLPAADQARILKTKQNEFKKALRTAGRSAPKRLLDRALHRTSNVAPKQFVERALKVLEAYDELEKTEALPSKELVQELQSLTMDMAHQSFKNGMRDALSAFLCATGVVAGATAAPSHGISIGVAGAVTVGVMALKHKIIAAAKSREELFQPEGEALIRDMNVMGKYHASVAVDENDLGEESEAEPFAEAEWVAALSTALTKSKRESEIEQANELSSALTSSLDDIFEDEMGEESGVAAKPFSEAEWVANFNAALAQSRREDEIEQAFMLSSALPDAQEDEDSFDI